MEKKLDFTKEDLIEWLDADDAKGVKTMNTFVLTFLASLLVVLVNILFNAFII